MMANSHGALGRRFGRRPYMFAMSQLVQGSQLKLEIGRYGRGYNASTFRARRAAETDCTGRIRPSLPRASRPQTGR